MHLDVLNISRHFLSRPSVPDRPRLEFFDWRNRDGRNSTPFLFHSRQVIPVAKVIFIVVASCENRPVDGTFFLHTTIERTFIVCDSGQSPTYYTSTTFLRFVFAMTVSIRAFFRNAKQQKRVRQPIHFEVDPVTPVAAGDV